MSRRVKDQTRPIRQGSSKPRQANERDLAGQGRKVTDDVGPPFNALQNRVQAAGRRIDRDYLPAVERAEGTAWQSVILSAPDDRAGWPTLPA